MSRFFTLGNTSFRLSSISSVTMVRPLPQRPNGFGPRADLYEFRLGLQGRIASIPITYEQEDQAIAVRSSLMTALEENTDG